MAALRSDVLYTNQPEAFAGVCSPENSGIQEARGIQEKCLRKPGDNISGIRLSVSAQMSLWKPRNSHLVSSPYLSSRGPRRLE
jgi:hypothetical protein